MAKIPPGHIECPKCEGKRIRAELGSGTNMSTGGNKRVYVCAKCLGIGYIPDENK